ncbi:uncharacterized protein LOC120683577 isoform X2 [Panicum virgatum]|nr:uncharacterized protein LOC120683577 isoform X2 [Panicum virgatum]
MDKATGYGRLQDQKSRKGSRQDNSNKGTYQKLSLGASIVEPLNKDFWVTLGSISSDLASKQKVTSNWQHKHLIVLEALIPHLPCHGLEISLQLPVDL